MTLLYLVNASTSILAFSDLVRLVALRSGPNIRMTVHTSSVRAPMNCEVALTSCSEAMASIVWPIECQSALLRRYVFSALLIPVVVDIVGGLLSSDHLSLCPKKGQIHVTTIHLRSPTTNTAYTVFFWLRVSISVTRISAYNKITMDCHLLTPGHTRGMM